MSRILLVSLGEIPAYRLLSEGVKINVTSKFWDLKQEASLSLLSYPLRGKIYTLKQWVCSSNGLEKCPYPLLSL